MPIGVRGHCGRLRVAGGRLPDHSAERHRPRLQRALGHRLARLAQVRTQICRSASLQLTRAAICSSAGLVADGFKTLLDWAKTGDTVPYTNFNDYLHYYH